MKIISNYLYKNNYFKNKTNTRKNIFPATPKLLPRTIRKLPLALVTASLISGIIACKSRLSGVESFHGCSIEYYNVDKNVKQNLLETFNQFHFMLPDDKDFLRGTTLILTDKYKDLDGNSSFGRFVKDNSNSLEKYTGFSYYSDNYIPRTIIVKANEEKINDDLYYISMTGDDTNLPMLKHALMHEVGHQFDEYFGHRHDDNYARDYDSMMYIKEQNPFDSPYFYDCITDKEKEIVALYNNNNSLSDKNEFKKAVLEDLQYIEQLQKTAPGYLPTGLDYYISDFDLNEKITSSDIEKADKSRSEIYANLFSYAIGQNDGNKNDFLRVFANCYKIVKSDINNILGTGFVK